MSFSKERGIGKYQPDTSANSGLKIFTEFSADVVLKLLYLILENNQKIKSPTLSESSYKVTIFLEDSNFLSID